MLDKYVQLLKKGDVVAFPTETVYGLGADAWNMAAIKKVYTTKGRPSDNPLIIHISSFKMIQDFAAVIPAEAKSLAGAFWPGPLTLIFKKKPEVLECITGGLDTVALRWPSHPISQELIALTGPLVAPSANSSGRPSPTRAEHVKEDFGEDFPVIDAGETQIGLESTVLDISEQPFRIYRPGAISKQQIEEVLGMPVETGGNTNSSVPAKSPGTKYSHYTPKARVRWLKSGEQPAKGNTLYLLHKTQSNTWPDRTVCYEGDYAAMAHELFDRFRKADHNKLSEIAIEPFSEEERANHPIIEALINRISKAIG